MSSLSTQEYKWVPANCWGYVTNCGGMTCDGLASCSGGVEILLAASSTENGDRSCSYDPVGSKASFFLFLRAVKPTLKSFDHFTTPRFVFDEMVKLTTHIITFISHRLTFEQFYWLFQVTWYKIGGRVSRNTPRPKRYLSSDFWITIKERTPFSVQCFHF